MRKDRRARFRRTFLGMLLLGVCIAATSGCDEPRAEDPSADPSADRTTTTTSPIPSPSGSAPADGVPSPDLTGRCSEPLKLGERSVSGADFADCTVLGMTLSRYARETIKATGQAAETALIDHGPPFRMSLETADMAFIRVDDAAWMKTDHGWVQADENSSDGDAVIAAGLAKAAVAGADPRFLKEQWSKFKHFEISPTTETVNGVTCTKLESQENVAMLGTTVHGTTVWVDKYYRPIRTKATATFAGISTTTVQDFFDWGKPVKIESPKLP